MAAKAKRKPGRPKKKHAGGRPPAATKEVIAKLEEAFMWGCTNLEACLFANISVDVLYRYQKANPEFSKRKEALKESPALNARKRVAGEVENDTGTAKWYLERKRGNEFNPTQRVEAEIKTELGISPALDDMFNKTYKGETK